MKREELIQTAKPILFNAEMTKAILDGRKVQTRRVIYLKGYIKPKVIINEFKEYVCEHCGHLAKTYKNEKACLWCLKEFVKPKYKTGDILWVREPARVTSSYHDVYMQYEYLSDGLCDKIKYPERFTFPLPRWIAECKGVPNGCIKEMARIFLKVANVRVEGLQDISEEDIKKEGWSDKMALEDYADIYKEYGAVSVQRAWWIKLWDSTAPKGYKYKDNPHVFVYEFERVEV